MRPNLASLVMERARRLPGMVYCDLRLQVKEEKSAVAENGNAKASGNLNLEVQITETQQRAILTRITSDDLEKRMPRNPDGTAGTKLTVDELRLVFNAKLSTNGQK
jgi:hypothetical protein